MKSWFKSFLFLIGLMPMLALAQIAPLPVDQDTVALWNFDSDVDDQVVDSGSSPLNGTAYTTEHLAVPDIDPAFNLARKFSSQSSFVDLGVVQGSKIDFTGWSELSVEAVVHLTQSATGDHTIFSSENVRLMVINNQLAGYVRQPGGLFGVVSDRTLALNTTYRVGFHYKDRDIILTINGRVDSKVRVDHGIQAPQFSNSRASIGGDLFARFVPGFVDDVRVRNVVGVDVQGPGIELVEPSSFQLTVPRPNFLINLSDDLSGVDVDSIEVYLNGIQQTGITKTATQISGQLDDDMSSTLLNEVKVIVTDLQGNTNQKSFFFSYVSILGRQEYITDQHTLALWHMNDYSPGFMKDDSGHGRNGYGNVQQIQTAEGVFGLGRQFIRGGVINFDSIRFDNLQFTLESWLRPTSNTTEEIIFYNGQIKIARYNSGHIRTVFYTTKGERSYQSSELLLPVNELHHFALSWDGTKKTQNLTFYIDGQIRAQMDVVSECDFDPIPKVGQIGSGFEGLMDEMRLSSIPRTAFSVPVSDNQVINFLTLRNGTSVNTAFPEFHATLNSANSINVSTMKILLNGALEEASQNLVVTETGIDGTFTNALQPGLNQLEISFLDNQGNQRKKAQYFFFIKKDGGSEYTADAKTAGLWHFNETQAAILRDATTNGSHFTGQPFSITSGVIGNGVRGSGTTGEKVPLNCRSFTVETFWKAHENYAGYLQLYQINNPTALQSLRVNPANGNLLVQVINTSNLEIEVPQAIPVDSAYHHIALVYDGSRAYSQLLLIVDGVVKRTFDYHNSCDFGGNFNLSIGQGNVMGFDEFRISKEAKYAFNMQEVVSDRPVLDSINVPDRATKTTPNLSLTFSVSDGDGINSQNTKVFLNGTEVEVTESGKKRINLSSDFSANLELENGANLITIKSQDMLGNDQVFQRKVYLFAKAAPGEYAADANTLFLYHLNEESGLFQDSGSSGVQLNDSGWTRVSGTFGGGASVGFYGGTHNHGDLTPNGGWSFEFWRKGGGHTDMGFFRAAGLEIGTSALGLAMNFNGVFHRQTENIVTDTTNFHHYAVVVDPSHFLDNVYLLVDGNVVYSTKVTSSLNLLNITGTVAYAAWGASMDEIRFSKVPRYEFVSSLE